MSNCNESYILSGPQDECQVPKESIGKIIFDCLYKRDPYDIIIVDGVTKETLTCGKLLQESISATTVFKDLGLQRGDTISIISENNLNCCPPVLAALYMGVTVNMVNPDYAYGELRHTLGICKLKIIFCSEMALENLLSVYKELTSVKQIILTESGSIQHKMQGMEDLIKATSTIQKNIQPEDLNCVEQNAFIFMSSGTTGLPKGVLMTHQNIRAIISQMVHLNYGSFTQLDTLLLVLPISHAFGLGTLIAAVVASMKVVLLKKFQPDMFLRSMQDHKSRITTSSMKDVLVSAAPLGKQLLEEVSGRLNNAVIRQAYGLTETCGGCTYQKIGDDSKPGSVGSLVPQITAKVWDYNFKKNLKWLEVGELCFKGPMIMKGYIGNPTATHECIDEEDFLHTGDLGYYDKDGHFYIMGRIKKIIKYKGFQVPPAELEALILSHSGVKDCGVIGIPDVRAGEVPLAFVVPENDTNITEQEIINFVAERISVEKRLYGGVVFLEEIPKNSSGKILRENLKEIFKKSG